MPKTARTPLVTVIYVIAAWAAKLKIQTFAATRRKVSQPKGKMIVFNKHKAPVKSWYFPSLTDQNFLNFFFFQKQKQCLGKTEYFMNYSSISVTSNALEQTISPHHISIDNNLLPSSFNLYLLLLCLAFQSQGSTQAARETSKVEDIQGGSDEPAHRSLVRSLPWQWLQQKQLVKYYSCRSPGGLKGCGDTPGHLVKSTRPFHCPYSPSNLERGGTLKISLF